MSTSGKIEIEGLAGHVLAELGDRARAPPQHGVGLRRPIGRDDVDRLARPDRAVDLPDDVEEARLHPGRLVGAPVAQEPVQLLEPALVVIAVALEGDRGVFLGVRMEDRDGAGIAVRDRVLGRAGAAQEGRDGDGAEDRAARRGARRRQPDAAAKRPDPKLLKSSSPLSAATWRGLFGEGRLAGNGYRPVKPTNPVVPSGALGRTMANSGPQRRAGPAKAAAIDGLRGLTTSASLYRVTHHQPGCSYIGIGDRTAVWARGGARRRACRCGFASAATRVPSLGRPRASRTLLFTA